MIDKFEKLGMTPGEAKVYYALIKLKSSTVGPIVKSSGIAYSNIYDILERLIKKGLVTYVLKEKTRYFQITSTNNLSEYLDDEEIKLAEKKKILSSILPQINSYSKDISQDAEIFIGFKGISSAYDVMLQNAKNKDEFCYFFVPMNDDAGKFYGRIYRKFVDAKITLRGISLIKHKNSPDIIINKNSEMRFVDFPIPSTVDIFKEYLLFISWDKPIAFLIRSKEMSDNYKAYFDSIWVRARK